MGAVFVYKVSYKCERCGVCMENDMMHMYVITGWVDGLVGESQLTCAEHAIGALQLS